MIPSPHKAWPQNLRIPTGSTLWYLETTGRTRMRGLSCTPHTPMTRPHPWRTLSLATTRRLLLGVKSTGTKSRSTGALKISPGSRTASSASGRCMVRVPSLAKYRLDGIGCSGVGIRAHLCLACNRLRGSHHRCYSLTC